MPFHKYGLVVSVTYINYASQATWTNQGSGFKETSYDTPGSETGYSFVRQTGHHHLQPVWSVRKLD